MALRLRRSLAAKLALAILSGCLVVYLAILVDVHEQTRLMLAERIQREGANVIDAAAARIDAELRRVEEAPTGLAEALRRQHLDRQGLEDALCQRVSANATIFGAAAAFEPRAFDPGIQAFSPYCYREGGRLRVKDLGLGSYAYHVQDWYRRPREQGQALWSEPYFDEGGGGILMATYSVPVRDGADAGRVIGIATADVALEWLQRFMAGIRVGRGGYAFLISPSGRIVTHPEPRLAMRVTLAELAQGDAGLARLAQAVAERRRGIERAQDPASQAPIVVVHRPLEATGWTLAVVSPERETLADVNALQRRMWLTGIVGALALAVVVVGLTRRVTRPLGQLARAAQDVAGGRLDAPLPRIRSGDEIGRLTGSFADMQAALSLYMEEVKGRAAAEERLESELRIARDIQMSLLPHAADLSAERVHCDVFGLLEPARAVGGDLFNVVRRGPAEICFVIGDVSDKGIPAALFMAMTDVHFEAAARELSAPEAILARINEALVPANTANMFVTLVCGVLRTDTGRLALAMGGHTRPVLLPRAGPPRLVPGDLGTVVGVAPGLSFARVDLVLEGGDALLLYTDGVTEAHDAAGQLFGEDRLLAHLAQAPRATAAAVAQGVYDAVIAHSRGVPQFDDIALLVVRHTAARVEDRAPAPSRLELSSEVTEMARASGWLHEWCAAHGVAEEVRHDLDLALDEVMANVVHHGYGPGAPGPIWLRLSEHGGRVRLVISDRAPAFNPLEERASEGRADDVVGGWGLSLLRRCMDLVEYERENGENRLILERQRERTDAGRG
jgi:phosphoserine phosphatase RsbU/P